MPELPEVETIRCSIEPHITGRKILCVVVRTTKLRQVLHENLATLLTGQFILSVTRRGKYLLVRCTSGTLIIHLGMTGIVYVASVSSRPEKHDHLDLVLDNDTLLRLRDPRRFGTVLWTTGEPFEHPLLTSHGPEPLEDSFTDTYLHRLAMGRKVTIKQLIMDGRVVAGIGNIYASESLFRAGVLPMTAAKDLSPEQCQQVCAAIKEVLAEAIAAGVQSLTSSIDIIAPKGYFPFEFRVYGREGTPCYECGNIIKMTRVGGRSTYFCPICQK